MTHKGPWLGDWAITVYGVVVVSLLVARAPAVPMWWAFALGHVAVVAAIWTLVRFDRPGIVGHLRAWDALAAVPILFFMAMMIVHRVNPTDYDDALLGIDRAIGGIAVLKSAAALERPWLTDLFKLAWIGYYPLALFAGIPLYRKGREAFVPLKEALVLGWMASYLAYFAWPAKGPGWYPEATGVPQPKFEAGVVSGAAKAAIVALEAPEPRHTFPSGHTIIAVLVAWFLLRHRPRPWTWIGVPLAAAVVVSTIYLRYHYLVDVLVGLAVAAGCIAAAEWRRSRIGAAAPVESSLP